MAFDFKSLITSSTASTFALSTNDSIDFSVTTIDQEVLHNAINDAVQPSVDDIAEEFGGIHLPGNIGDIFGDGRSDLGTPGPSGMTGIGNFSDSLGAIPAHDAMNSLQDLMGWAEGMMDPNRVDTGAGGSDPFHQPQHQGGIPDNVHVSGGGGEGYTVDSKTGVVTLGAVETASVHRWGTDKVERHGAGDSYKVDQYTMSVDTMTRYADGSYQITHSSRDTAGNVTHTGTIYDKTGKVVETKTTETAHKFPPLPVSFDPEGGNGGIDGGSDPTFSGNTNGPSDNFHGTLGQVYLHIGIGTSGGEGEANSSFADLMAALGGVMPSESGVGEGGQGEGADGNIEAAPILPPYYVEHQVNLIGAIIDPIPYVI
jgi:hypothetical protein